MKDMGKMGLPLILSQSHASFLVSVHRVWNFLESFEKYFAA